MTRIKICGITSIEDARAALHFGADALGLVFASSPRQVSVDQAAMICNGLPKNVTIVGVFVDETPDEIKQSVEKCGLSHVQIHGTISELHMREFTSQLIPALTVCDNNIIEVVRRQRSRTVLLDAHHPDRSGASHSFDWAIAKEAGKFRNIILAGGLIPDNVQEALEIARPYAVDVSSGVEDSPGKKDRGKLKTFIERVHEWDSRTNAGISAHSADDLFPKR